MLLQAAHSVCQSESGWSPHFFMIDKSKASKRAIKEGKIIFIGFLELFQ
jgi:hypothetical protein